MAGIVDADSAAAARQKLRGLGVFPIKLKETSSRPNGVHPNKASISSFFRRVKQTELSVTTRHLSVLLGAGITLVASLDALIAQVKNQKFKKIIAEIKESITEGNSLAFSLSQHPRVFSPVYINMVQAGEASGSLDVVLDRLAAFSEHQQALRGRIKAALAYPVILSFIAVLILFYLITFVVPSITRIFEDMHQVLPLPTLLLIGISDFLKSFWWLVLLSLAVFILLAQKLVKTPRGRHVWDEIKLRIPVFGAINVRIAMARFGRTLGSLLESGVSLLTALQIVKNIVNNTKLGRVIDDATEQIEKGKGLASPLGQSRWFPPIAIQMISAGEHSGQLENMLDKIGDIYEKEAESRIMAATALLEPVMILAMGVTVLFIVLSILLPIFEMNQMVR